MPDLKDYAKPAVFSAIQLFPEAIKEFLVAEVESVADLPGWPEERPFYALLDRGVRKDPRARARLAAALCYALDRTKPDFDPAHHKVVGLKAVTAVAEYGFRKYVIPARKRSLEAGSTAREACLSAPFDNYRAGQPTDYWNACARHSLAMFAGELTDPESRLPHAAHALWSLFAAVELDKLDPVPEIDRP